MKRRPRRAEGRTLQNMTDGELKALKHFGNLVSSTGRETFRATPAERAEACRILVERGFSLPASPLRPDPHTVLSGLPEDSAACRDRCAP
jgi:hypothetical protein